ncbi:MULTISPECIES: hypothetical protein, partial [Anaerolinea]|uniref:hypothetical protein n=1 Tax=Anaerolinea TaxID=233189 RepID=UPI0026ED515C
FSRPGGRSGIPAFPPVGNNFKNDTGKLQVSKPWVLKNEEEDNYNGWGKRGYFFQAEVRRI